MKTTPLLRRAVPLQNRVDPYGSIHAVSARGTMMGNRGGRIHDPETKTLTNRRRWASKSWIICLTSFKDRQREVMGESYTELFFLDEVTALAAGHRPCFECRRQAAKAFQLAWQKAHNLSEIPKVGVMDPILHAERLQQQQQQQEHHQQQRQRQDGSCCRRPLIDRNKLVSGVMIEHNNKALALKDGTLLEWSFEGYTPSTLSISDLPSTVCCLTPPATVAVLANGYEPIWHESAC